LKLPVIQLIYCCALQQLKTNYRQAVKKEKHINKKDANRHAER
jgi:hypothetical protein